MVGHIHNGVLRSGSNTLEIRRAGRGDNFLIRGAMVHWREPQKLCLGIFGISHHIMDLSPEEIERRASSNLYVLSYYL
jgi:hypothetical protein